MQAKRTMILINIWDKGGMKHYADALAHAMQQYVSVHYISTYPVTETDHLTHHRIRFTQAVLSWPNLRAMLQLGRHLLGLRGTVYMTSDHPMLVVLYPLLFFRRSVLLIHDPQSHQGERLSKVLFHKLHLNVFSLFLSRFVVHSERIADKLPWMIRVRKPKVIPHLHYRPVANLSPIPLKNSPFRFLFFGRILSYKGLTDLYNAMAQLPKDQFHLTTAGEGLIEEAYKGDNHTLINRFVTDAEMDQLFHECHALVLPYRAASQSGVAYMALAYGKPVIATHVGAIPDVIHHGINGLLVPPNDLTSLIQAMKDIPRSYQQLCDGIAQNTSDNFDRVTQGVQEVCFD